MKKKATGLVSVLLALALMFFFGAPGAEEAAAPQPETQIVQSVVEEVLAPEDAEAELPEEVAEEASEELPEEAFEEPEAPIAEDGWYTTREDVALYIHTFGKLPDNFITKNEARELGWEGGGLEDYAPGKSIGGDRFGNYEGLLPKADGRKYTECDIDTMGRDSRGPKRIVFSNDGLIYYTQDHYESFELLYGEP